MDNRLSPVEALASISLKYDLPALLVNIGDGFGGNGKDIGQVGDSAPNPENSRVKISVME